VPQQQGIRSSFQLAIHTHIDDSQGGLVDYLENDVLNGDVQFIPNGTGRVRFGTYGAIVAETLQGFVTIKDSGGASRKVGIVS